VVLVRLMTIPSALPYLLPGPALQATQSLPPLGPEAQGNGALLRAYV
jgi:hypothetical protein